MSTVADWSLLMHIVNNARFNFRLSSASELMTRRIQIHYNAPFTLTYSLICVVALAIIGFTGGWGFQVFSIGEGFSWVNPLQYPRLFLHVVGHSSPEHLVSNLTVLLLIGPILEEKYGVRRLLVVTLVTALITALPMVLLAPLFGGGNLLGASGVVFAFIVLSSYTRAKSGALPMTFVLVCVLFLGQEVYRAIFAHDHVAQFAHILGGLVGGFFANRWR